MAENLPVSQLQDKDGTTYDIAAKRMSGTRTITVTGDVVGSVTTNLSGAVSLDVGIADNAVDTSCIADGAVTTSCLADNNVTLQKLSSEVRTSVGQAHTHSNKDELDNYAAAGSASVPIYVAEDGTPTACTDDFARDGELDAEATARANADTQLQTNIDAEATTRGNADTALGNRITVLEAKTALSDFEDDITQQTYDATSEDPISGKGVAEALTYGGASWKEVGHGGSSKEYRVADINFGSYGNYIGKTWKFDWAVASNTNNIAFSCGGTLNIQIRSQGSGYVPLVALSLTRTPGSKMAMNLPTFKLYQLADTEAYTIRYILTATAGNFAYMGAFYKLTAAYNQQGKESDITLYEKTELVLPEGYVACDTTRNVSYQTAYTNSATAVGSSTAPVYVDANGQVTACGSSLAVSVTGNAATATKATQDASGNVITSTYATKTEMTDKNYLSSTLLNSSNDLNAVIGDSSTRPVSYYRWTNNSVPSNAPCTDGYMVVSRLGTYTTQKVWRLVNATNNGNRYWWRGTIDSGSTWDTWQLCYMQATSTYNASGTQQVNGTAVASALSSYMPLSRLKPSTDMAGFDSDDTNAYTGKAIGQKITDAISGNVGGWLGNKTVDEVNELEASEMKTGDYVTLTDGGTVTLGNVAVTAGDEIYWVGSTSVWQKKDNTVYIKRTDIAKSGGVGVVKSTTGTDGYVKVDSDGAMDVVGWNTVKSDITTAQSNISTLQNTSAQHTTDIATVNSTIKNMALSQKGGEGKYVRSVSQVNGQLYAEEATLDTNVADGGDNAPTSGAVKTYVDAQVEAEAAARESAIELAVGNESSARDSAIAAETSARESAIAAEVTARDSAISSAIATEVTSRNQAIANGTWDAVYNPTSETLQFTNLSFTTSS